MERYRCDLLNAELHLIASSICRCADAQAALDEARSLLADRDACAAVAVWRDDQYIGFVLRSDAVRDIPYRQDETDAPA